MEGLINMKGKVPIEHIEDKECPTPDTVIRLLVRHSNIAVSEALSRIARSYDIIPKGDDESLDRILSIMATNILSPVIRSIREGDCILRKIIYKSIVNYRSSRSKV